MKKFLKYSFLVGAIAFSTFSGLAYAGNQQSYSRPSPSSQSSPPSSSQSSRPPSSPPTMAPQPSYQTPAQKPPAPVNTAPQSVSRPSVAQSAPPVAPPRQSNIDNRMAVGQSKTSLDAFKADQNKFNKPAVGVPPTRQDAVSSPVYQQYGNRWNNPDHFYASRNAAYDRLPPQYNTYYHAPPVWVSAGSPAYGSYSGIFLGSLLGVGVGMAIDSSYHQWAYSHRHDIEYQQWHADMMHQAQTNAELRERLTVLDREVANLEAQKAPVTNALPKDVDPSLVIAPETVMMATSKDSYGWGTVGVGLLGCVIIVGILGVVVLRNRR